MFIKDRENKKPNNLPDNLSVSEHREKSKNKITEDQCNNDFSTAINKFRFANNLPKKLSKSWFKKMVNIGCFNISYIEIFNFEDEKPATPGLLDINIISEERADQTKICEEYGNNVGRHATLPKAAIVGYNILEKNQNQIDFRFKQTCYGQYLDRLKDLDKPYNDEISFTKRDHIIDRMSKSPVIGHNNEPLPVICGAGLFILEKNQLLVTQHSRNQQTHPGVWTFSASCAMNWGGCPNPIMELSRRAVEEIAHQVDPKKTSILSFGIDPMYCYFHFTCVENSEGVHRDLEYIKKVANGEFKPAKTMWIDVTEDRLIEHLWNRAWEPAAEYALIQLAKRDISITQLEESIEKYYEIWKENMIEEWTERATRPDKIPKGNKDFIGLSSRYDEKDMQDEESKHIYSKKVFEFMEDDLNNKKIVVEFGCGPGRITRELAYSKKKYGYELYALDMCKKMLELNKVRLEKEKLDNEAMYRESLNEEEISKIAYTRAENIAVLDRVLIHNVSNFAFRRVLSQLEKIADIIFIFEDISNEKGREYSDYTRIRSKSELIEGFREVGYQVVKTGSNDTKICNKDVILFCKFARIL